MRAAERLSSGNPVYQLEDLDAHTKPPFCTLLFLPLHHLNFFWLERIWDLINLSVFVGLAIFFAKQFESDHTRSDPFRLALLGILFTLSSWNAEIRLGQFNVIGMGLILVAALAKPAALRSLALFVAMLLKPTNIIFLPWIARFGKNPFRLVLGTTIWGIFFSAIYCFHFGTEAFIKDHQSWLAYLGPSSAKHIIRLDNLGLPSASALLLGNSFQNFFLGLGVILTGFISWKWPRSPWPAFSLAAVMVVIFSPMAWPQNYSLLLPLVIWIWRYWDVLRGVGQSFISRAHAIAPPSLFAHAIAPPSLFGGVLRTPERKSKVIGSSLVVFYVTQQLYNPSTWDYWGPLGRIKLPLVGTLCVLVLFLWAISAPGAKPALENQSPKAL